MHYHQDVDSQGFLCSSGSPSINRQIDRVNEAIGHMWQESFPAVTFWQWWNLSNQPAGLASRGSDRPLADRDLLTSVLSAVAPASVLHVGCGDGEAARNLPMASYVGIDPSPEAVLRAEILRPEGRFHVGRLAEFPVRADLTICLDTLAQESDAAAYRDQVNRLWESAQRALVISGYEHAPDAVPLTGFFHEPLSATLRAVAPEAELYPLRAEHGITTFVVLRPPVAPHPRDFSVHTLESVIDRHPDPLMLLGLRLEGQRTFGFFPDHAPRLWEYPAAADLVFEYLPQGSRLVDVGAGVTPLAPFLASRGYVIDTVDPSDIHRTWPPAEDWNEWGFVDYAEAGLGHRSWNCTLGELPESPSFDGAMSISVIEHIPATERRALLRDIALRLRPGGLMVLTIDLVRGGNDLWNRNRGQIVDERRHGTFGDVVSEGAAAGFELIRKDVVREWGDVDVDIGLIVMRRTEASVKSWRRALRRLRQ